MKAYCRLLIVCLLVSAAVPVFSTGRNPSKRRGDERHAGRPEHPMMQAGYGNKDHSEYAAGAVERYLRHKENINLTEKQEQEIKDMVFQHKQTAIKQQAEIKVARLELLRILSSDTPDFAAAKEKITEVSRIQLNLKLAVVDMQERAHKLLTADQRKKLAELRQERRKSKIREKSKKRGK